MDGRQASQIPRFRVFLRLCLHEDMHRNLEGCVERDLVSLKCMLPLRFGRFFSLETQRKGDAVSTPNVTSSSDSLIFSTKKNKSGTKTSIWPVLIEGHNVHIFSGHSEKNLTVSVDDGDRQRMENSQSTVFLLDPGVSVVGLVVAQEPASAGPDSLVLVNASGTKVEVARRAGGRSEDTMAMFDISIANVDQIVDTVGGWLGMHGAAHAGKAPSECASLREVRKVRHHFHLDGTKSDVSVISFRDRTKGIANRASGKRACLA